MTKTILPATIEQAPLVEFDETSEWRRAVVLWLSGKRANTRIAYQRILSDFLLFANVPPTEVTGDMVNAWKLHLQSSGRRDTTIAQRLAGLSSYFDYLQRKACLINRNPVDAVERSDLDDSPYGNAKPMTKSDFARIWHELDGTTPAGAMYRALFLTYALTGKRRAELLRLRGRDIAIDGNIVHYTVRTKGGKAVRRTIPPAAWDAIRNYLNVAGRHLPLADDEPLFVATRNTASYIDTAGRYIQRSVGEPLSGTAASEALKRVAERAGVDPRRVTIHGMRHLAARIWRESHAGSDIRGLQQFLGHTNVATTQIYDEQLFGDESTDYNAMAAALFGAGIVH